MIALLIEGMTRWRTTLFQEFWWLIFPLAAFAFGASRNWLTYRANREMLDLIKTYAASGREPPPELLAPWVRAGRTPRRPTRWGFPWAPSNRMLPVAASGCSRF